MKHIQLFEEIGITEESEKNNHKFVTSPRPEIEPIPQKPWNKKIAFGNDLKQELSDVCDRFMRYLDPEDIKEVILELSQKYGEKNK